MTRGGAAILAAAMALGLCRTTHAEPSNGRLVVVGLALAPIDYALGVALHEGSHAVMAKALGATVEQLRIFPPGIDPLTHTFRFGWTHVRGLPTRTAKVGFYLAPKLTDALLLGGFTALVFTDAWPSNKYGQLALTVVGTGLWVDFAKDVVPLSPHNDVSKAFENGCLTGWREVSARLGYAAVSAGFALAVVRGYQRLFAENRTAVTSMVIPLVQGAF